MKQFARRIERQFQKNIQQNVLASELKIKVRRMRECFSGSGLPFPTAEVIAAWNDLPNETVDVLPMSMKVGMVLLRAPPPTPTGLAFDIDKPKRDEPPLHGGSDDSWLLVDDTDTLTPDVAAFRYLELCVASQSDPTLPVNSPDQSLNGKIDEEDSLQPTYNSPSSSDHESLPSSSSQDSPTPVGFYNMVNQWWLDYRTRGLGPFIESLIAFGVVSLGTGPLASRIARAVSKMAAKISYMEGKDMETTIRLTAMEAFEKYWEPSGTCTEILSAQASTEPPTPYGINIASLMGSLFDAGVSSAKDIYRCLSVLSEGEKCLDRLYAMHALLVQANDKLCKSRNLSALMQFKDAITSRDETGEYLWITGPRSKAIISDILATIERWLVSQALKRDQSRLSPSRRTIRQRAVGPRLHEPVIASL